MSIAVAAPVINPHEAVKKVTTIATLPEVTAKIIATVENPKSKRPGTAQDCLARPGTGDAHSQGR